MKIEKKTIPKTRTTKKKGQTKYPFAEMEVGKAFKVEYEKRYSVSTLASSFAKRQSPEWKFTVRKDENGELYCYRIK